MLQSWTVLFFGLAYVGFLFGVATWGDRLARRRVRLGPKPFIYALSLGVYCTSWTYFGSVGVASRSGFDFLPIYLGPVLVFAVGWKLVRSVVDVAKRQNITSIADFIAARYGKNEALGAIVALIAVVGIVPYISIQLKALSFSLETMMNAPVWPDTVLTPVPHAGDLALLVTMALAAFAILFGTRHIDTTEHQDGMMLAIALESIVKLAAFLAVGAFVTFWLMDGPRALVERVEQSPDVSALFARQLDGGRWLTMTFLSMCAILLLPRQFHVTVVENASRDDVRRAAWLFPLYLAAINLFVVPIAIAGLVLLGPSSTDGDTFVLALPVIAGNKSMALIAFIGGLSAATAMVIVETVALSIMVCNNVVVPLLLRRRDDREAVHNDMGRLLITIRRWAICGILLLAYSYYLMAGNSAALAQTGLISFAAVAQFAPAFFGGLLWKRATAAGATAGIVAGFAMWAYTLLVPSFIDSGWIERTLVDEGPFGVGLLRPRMLFNLEFDPLTHGVLWSLIANISCYVGFSLLRSPTPIERLQANAFVSHDLPGAAAGSFRMWRTAVNTGQVEATVARYLGKERTREAFAAFADQRGLADDPSAEADISTLKFGEHLLASAVGTASSRLVMALLLQRHTKSNRNALRLLDDASAAIQYNRDILQSAIDNVPQGIAVFDRERVLICWNRQFRQLLDLPNELVRVGTPLDEVVEGIAANTARASGGGRETADSRMKLATASRRRFRERLVTSGRVIDIHSDRMADGGIVVTFADVTESVEAEEALQRANETLERRVGERTSQLTQVNIELSKAKADAEAANLDKTRFIAAASHDILQPLNAARLFTSALVDRNRKGPQADIVRNVDAALESVEDILSALLDISKLDAGAMKPELSNFDIGELLTGIGRDFSPIAADKGLKLEVVASRRTVRSDRRLLRRILQNLVSNAIKYTETGKVVIGCRRAGAMIRIEVHDTGAGIPADKIRLVFREFERLGQDRGRERGLGLGLSIVERIGKMLKHPVAVRSTPGRGTAFSVTVPAAASGELPAASDAVRSSPAARFEGLRVLVVDDEQSIVAGMTSLLSGWGAVVTGANSAGKALAAAKSAREPFDAILADYHIHRADGLALIARIRARSARHIPALLITADRSKEVQDLAAAASVGYLRKPVRPAALRAALSQARISAEAAE